MPGDPRIRASDADRDRVASLLREHHAAGRLTAEEFNERLDKVYEAYAEEGADFDKLAAKQQRLEAILASGDAHTLEHQLEVAAEMADQRGEDASGLLAEGPLDCAAHIPGICITGRTSTWP